MLSQKQIEEIIQTIVKGYDPEKVYIFGSYVNGNAREDSDLDICVIKETTDRSIERRMKVSSLFRSFIHSMDILVYTPAEFEESKNILNTMAFFISRSSQLVYEKNVRTIHAKSTA